MRPVNRRKFLGCASVAAIVPAAASATPVALPPVKKDCKVTAKGVKKVKLDDNSEATPGNPKTLKIDFEDDGGKVKFMPPFGKKDSGGAPKDRPTISFPGSVASLTRMELEVDIAEIQLVGGNKVQFPKVKITPVTGVKGGGESAAPTYSECCIWCEGVIYCGLDICVACGEMFICCPL